MTRADEQGFRSFLDAFLVIISLPPPMIATTDRPANTKKGAG
jgi:hypothetical protein